MLQELGENLLIFLATMILTTATCTKKAVTCDSRPQESAEVRSP